MTPNKQAVEAALASIQGLLNITETHPEHGDTCHGIFIMARDKAAAGLKTLTAAMQPETDRPKAGEWKKTRGKFSAFDELVPQPCPPLIDRETVSPMGDSDALLPCRKAFEKWLAEKSLSTATEEDMLGNENYKYPKVEAMWYAWKAAWNTRLQPAVVDDLDALKKECHLHLHREIEGDFGCEETKTGASAGINVTIDHLASRGMLGKAPEGMVLVPREPTEEMLQVMWEEMHTETTYEKRLKNCYKAMIQAAKKILPESEG